MTLAGCLHRRELRLIELRVIDISPIECRPVHRETGRHCAVGANDYVVLACTAVPFGKVQLAIRVLDNSDNSGIGKKFHKLKPSACMQRECVTHPLLVDSEIHDGVRFGWDLARNPLNYVNACVD